MARAMTVRPASMSKVRQINMRMTKFMEQNCEHDVPWVQCKRCAEDHEKDMGRGNIVRPEHLQQEVVPEYMEWGDSVVIQDRFCRQTGASYIGLLRRGIRDNNSIDLSNVIVDFQSAKVNATSDVAAVFAGAWHQQFWLRLAHPIGDFHMAFCLSQIEQLYPHLEAGREKKWKRRRTITVDMPVFTKD